MPIPYPGDSKALPGIPEIPKVTYIFLLTFGSDLLPLVNSVYSATEHHQKQQSNNPAMSAAIQGFLCSPFSSLRASFLNVC